MKLSRCSLLLFLCFNSAPSSLSVYQKTKHFFHKIFPSRRVQTALASAALFFIIYAYAKKTGKKGVKTDFLVDENVDQVTKNDQMTDQESVNGINLKKLNDVIDSKNIVKSLALFNETCGKNISDFPYSQIKIDQLIEISSTNALQREVVNKYINCFSDIDVNKKIELLLKVLNYHDLESLRQLKDHFYTAIVSKKFDFGTFNFFAFINAFQNNYAHYNIAFDTLEILQNNDYDIDIIMKKSGGEITLCRYFLNKQQRDRAFHCFLDNISVFKKFSFFVYSKEEEIVKALLKSFDTHNDDERHCIETIFQAIWDHSGKRDPADFLNHCFQYPIAVNIFVKNIEVKSFLYIFRSSGVLQHLLTHFISSVEENGAVSFNAFFSNILSPSLFFTNDEIETQKICKSHILSLLLDNPQFYYALELFTLEELAKCVSISTKEATTKVIALLTEQQQNNLEEFISLLGQYDNEAVLDYYIKKKQLDKAEACFKKYAKNINKKLIFAIDFFNLYQNDKDQQKIFVNEFIESTKKIKIYRERDDCVAKVIRWLYENKYTEELKCLIYKMIEDKAIGPYYGDLLELVVLYVEDDELDSCLIDFLFYQKNDGCRCRREICNVIKGLINISCTKPSIMQRLLHLVKNKIMVLGNYECLKIFKSLLKTKQFDFADELYQVYFERIKIDERKKLFEAFLKKGNCDAAVHCANYLSSEQPFIIQSIFDVKDNALITIFLQNISSIIDFEDTHLAFIVSNSINHYLEMYINVLIDTPFMYYKTPCLEAFVNNIKLNEIKDECCDGVVQLLQDHISKSEWLDFFMLVLQKQTHKAFLNILYEQLSEDNKPILKNMIYESLKNPDPIVPIAIVPLLKNMFDLNIEISENDVGTDFIHRYIAAWPDEKTFDKLYKRGFYFDNQYLPLNISPPQEKLLRIYGLYSQKESENFQGRLKNIVSNDTQLCLDLLVYFNTNRINNFSKWAMGFREIKKYGEQIKILIRHCFEGIRTLKLYKATEAELFKRAYTFVRFLSDTIEKGYFKTNVAGEWFLHTVDALICTPLENQQTIKEEKKYLNALIDQTPPIDFSLKIEGKTGLYWLVFHGYFEEFQNIEVKLLSDITFHNAITVIDQSMPGFKVNENDKESVLKAIQRRLPDTINKKEIEYWNSIVEKSNILKEKYINDVSLMLLK